MNDMTRNYLDVYTTDGGKPIKAWTRGVPVEEEARQQLVNAASMPFVYKHIAVMPDVHWGLGATVGSVIPTLGAVIPAAVGVDIGCGMAAVRLDGITANQLPDSLAATRSDIEAAVPVGFGKHELGGAQHKAVFDRDIDTIAFQNWVWDNHPKIGRKRKDRLEDIIISQFGTLGGGNHFIEVCLDENDDVWVMLHSGSRGIGNALGQYFIELAKEDMRRYFVNLPDENLAYLPEGTKHYDDYRYVVSWAQKYARNNRERMMVLVTDVLRRHLPDFTHSETAVNCHHNYVELESHFGQNVLVTRKGAVRARKGDLGIIPGSMGARSYIVRGKGHPESFHSCSHGAGRAMSRRKARETFTVDQHQMATEGVECRKDEDSSTRRDARRVQAD